MADAPMSIKELKIRAWDLSEEMAKLQEQWNSKQKELNKVSEEIKTHGAGPQKSTP